VTGAALPARLALGALIACAYLALPGAVRADTYRVVDADGIVHYTNAPTDPMYQRLGLGRTPAPSPAPARPEAWTGGLAPLIREAAERYGVSEHLVRAVIRAESGFNPSAVSRKGARGLMQLMPQTASLLGVRDSFDPAENIDGGVRHLRRLIDRFGGEDLTLALAAYNAGEQAVTQHRGVPPYPETQGYVEKVLTFYKMTAGPAERPSSAGAAPQVVYRTVDEEGTLVYTNIPPRGVPGSLARR
jgi:soluble lytic murein transglycosylase